MYMCKFISTGGDKFCFGYDYGTLFDLDPMGELDVDVNTSQGFLQTGTAIESETVEGVSRELSGVFVSDQSEALAREMMDIFAPGTHGQLYFNEDYYCDCVVEKTPYILLTLDNRRRSFDLMLYCPYPYWLSVSETSYGIGGYTAAFELPVCYDTHIFGERNVAVYTDCNNSGSVERPLEATFTSMSSTTNYGLENISTDEVIQLNDTLVSGEKMHVYWEDGKLRIEKTVGEETENDFSVLDEDSDFFTLAPGENILKQFADEGADQLVVVVKVTPAVVGVVAEDV